MTTAPAEVARVRYLIDDVRAAVDFYTTHLGFTVGFDAAPAFAAVVLQDPAGNFVELFQPAPRAATH